MDANKAIAAIGDLVMSLLDWRETLSSKKFRALAIGVVGLIFGDTLGLDPVNVQYFIGLIGTYLVGQGIADHGKEAAKIKNLEVSG